MLSKTFQKGVKVIVAGATGREGVRAVEFMNSYGTNVVAGVTPGKGGQSVEGTPIFNTVKEAIDSVGPVSISSMYVPALSVVSAVKEAVEAGISNIHILTEGVPVRDLAYIKKLCNDNNVSLLGPGSMGVLIVGVGRVGMIGGVNPSDVYLNGKVSVISRSGGMANEIAHYLSLRSIGLRAVIHIGSEPIVGTRLVDQVKTFFDDVGTNTIVIFEEVSSSDLLGLAVFLKENGLKKRIMINLVGTSEAIIPDGAPFGHIDALVKGDIGERELNIKTLMDLGVEVVDSYEEFVGVTK